MTLLPSPRRRDDVDGSVRLVSPIRAVVAPEFVDELLVFADDLAGAVGWEVVIVDREHEHDLRVDVDLTHDAEEFSLRVSDEIVITSSSGAGVAYALGALRQLGPTELFGRDGQLTEWVLDGIFVVDGPAFEWRGAHLDVARHFFGLSAIKRFIDQLALHRLNYLHLHLNDDQGWRIEVPEYPRLTSVGAWRSGSPRGHENDGVVDATPHGGYFTSSDVAELNDYARRRHVTVVPEIDLPGHAQAVLAAYPHLGNHAGPYEVWTHWGISANILNVEEATLDFADHVVRYVASLFPGSPVHIGGDECPTREWEESPRARAVMASRGFTSARQLQGLYTTRLSQGLVGDGHEVLAWDEVLDADVSPSTTIVAWRDAHKGVEAAERGLRVVMAPMQSLYFDWLSSDDPDEPVAVAPRPYVTTWEQVYQFSIVPREMDPGLVGLIRGAQVQLWTEYITTPQRLDYMAFPRLCAFAEVAWGTAGSLATFRPRLVEHLTRLDRLGICFRPLDS